MSETHDELPGVTLWFKDSQVINRPYDNKKTVRVTLTAEINDDEVWAAAEKQLNEGLKIYTVDDFKTEMLKTLREENRSLTDRVRFRDHEINDLKNQLSMVRAALVIGSKPFGDASGQG